MHRDADGARLIRDRAVDRLPDPPGGIGRELVAAAVLELLDRTDEALVALLDEVEEAHAASVVLFRDRHHEAEVRLDQVLPREVTVLYDALLAPPLAFLERIGILVESLTGGFALLDAPREADLLLERE